MAILNCHSIARTHRVLASSALPNDSPPPPPSHHPHLKPNKSQKANYRKLKQQQQPSVLEIERAIGAGIFRDRDIHREAEEKTSLFDNILTNSVGKNEGSVEKKLRESGEWLIDQTERTSRSAGKQMLKIFVWMIPLWMFAFLLASGIVRLPLDAPFLEDLI